MRFPCLRFSLFPFPFSRRSISLSPSLPLVLLPADRCTHARRHTLVARNTRTHMSESVSLSLCAMLILLTRSHSVALSLSSLSLVSRSLVSLLQLLAIPVSRVSREQEPTTSAACIRGAEEARAGVAAKERVHCVDSHSLTLSLSRSSSFGLLIRGSNWQRNCSSNGDSMKMLTGKNSLQS